MSKVSARWVPKLISGEQKLNRVKISKELLSRLKAGKGFLDRIITDDELSLHYFDPESKNNRNDRIHGMNLYLLR